MNSKSTTISVLTINSASSIPLMHRLLMNLTKRYSIEVVECQIQGYPAFEAPIRTQALKTFESRETFAQQSIKFKAQKYSAIIRHVLSSLRNSKGIFYILDWQLLQILAPLTPFIQISGWRIVYHQFELIEELPALFRSGFALPIDLAIFPEVNRKDYFCKRYHKSRLKQTEVFPNTCVSSTAPEETALKMKVGQRRVIGHIGNVGTEHYLDSLIQLIKTAPEDQSYFIIVGASGPQVSAKLRDIIDKENVLCIGHISHNELHEYYSVMDIGLILYRGISQNYEYCAPNKLYEYWSYGIKVFGPPLEGLKAIFTDEIQGELIDFDSDTSIKNLLHACQTTTLCKEKTLSHFETFHSLGLHLQRYEESIANLNPENYKNV